MPVQRLEIVVVGDKELVSGLRLAGVSRYYTIGDGEDVRQNVRKALNELLADPAVGIVVLLEDYAGHVDDLITEVKKKKATTPVILQVPSKFGRAYRDVAEYYRAVIRRSIGLDIEI